MLQLWELGDSFKKVPDNNYKDSDIKKIYNKVLNKEISEEKELYDTPPELYIPEELYEEPFDPEDWLIEEENGEMRRPQNAKEIIDNIKYHYVQESIKFENRVPFDSTEIISNFRSAYNAELRNAKAFYPKWLSEEVNPKLIALGLLPESTYKKYKEEIRKVKSEWNRINRNAEKAQKAEKIPDKLNELLDLHDAKLLSFRKKGKNYIMDIQKDGDFFEDECRYRTLIFQDTKIIERDAGIYPPNTRYLYYEIYRCDIGYEIHIMFWTSKGLSYLTLECSGVKYRDFDKYKK